MIDVLRERIEKNGPMTFASFMRFALYEPGLGYYQRHIPGADSDYLTSPVMSPWFGRMIGTWIERIWESMGSPDPFTITEIGPGGADLAIAALKELPEPLTELLEWRFVEPFSHIAEHQMKRVQDEGIEVEMHWAASLGDLPPVSGALLANEVMDNFPIHLFEIKDGKALEVHVGIEDDRLTSVLVPVKDPVLMMRSTEAAAYLEDGDRFEVCLHFDEWAKAAAGSLSEGHLLIIDYGDKEPDLWQKRPAGSLVTYYRQMLGVDPYENVGEADITSHVNFSQLARCLETAGFSPLPLMTQREFLEDLGLAEVAAQLRERERELAAGGSHADAVSVMAERSRLEALATRGGLGDLKVFAATKDLSTD